MLQKLERRPIQVGAPGLLQPSRLLDEPVRQQGAKHAVTIDPAHSFYRRPRDRLPVSNEREGLKGGGRETAGASQAEEPFDVWRRFRTGHQLHSATQALKRKPTHRPANPQFLQRFPDSLRLHLKALRQVVQAYRLLGNEKQRLHQVLNVSHGSHPDRRPVVRHHSPWYNVLVRTDRLPAGVGWIREVAIAVVVVSTLFQACASQTPPPEGQPPQIVYSRDMGGALYAEIDEIASMRDGPFALQATDQQATSAVLYAADQLAENPLRRAALWFAAGQFHVYAQLDDLAPMTLNFRATGRVSVADGWPVLSLDRASIGAVYLPAFLRSWLARVATETIRDSGIRHRFHAIAISEGRLSVQGEVLPQVAH